MFRMEIETDMSALPAKARRSEELGGAGEPENRVFALLREWTRRDRIPWEGRGLLRRSEDAKKLTLTALVPFADAPEASYDAPEDAAARRAMEDWSGRPLRCPLCGERWKRSASDGRFAYRCDRCRPVGDAPVCSPD